MTGRLHPFLRALARPRRAETPPARFRVIFPDKRGTTFTRQGILATDLWVECWNTPRGWTINGPSRLTRPDQDAYTRPDGIEVRWMLAERIG